MFYVMVSLETDVSIYCGGGFLFQICFHLSTL